MKVGGEARPRAQFVATSVAAAGPSCRCGRSHSICMQTTRAGLVWRVISMQVCGPTRPVTFGGARLCHIGGTASRATLRPSSRLNHSAQAPPAGRRRCAPTTFLWSLARCGAPRNWPVPSGRRHHQSFGSLPASGRPLAVRSRTRPGQEAGANGACAIHGPAWRRPPRQPADPVEHPDHFQWISCVARKLQPRRGPTQASAGANLDRPNSCGHRLGPIALIDERRRCSLMRAGAGRGWKRAPA